MTNRPDHPFGPSNRSRARPAARGDSARLAASRSRCGTFETAPPASVPGIPPVISRDRAPL